MQCCLSLLPLTLFSFLSRALAVDVSVFGRCWISNDYFLSVIGFVRGKSFVIVMHRWTSGDSVVAEQSGFVDCAGAVPSGPWTIV